MRDSDYGGGESRRDGSMNRREFLGTMGLTGFGASFAGAFGTLGLLGAESASAQGSLSELLAANLPPNPRGVKLNLKPVMTNIIHTGAWEGPCRIEGLSPAEEKAGAERNFDNWARNTTRGSIDLSVADILEPVHITFAEDFVLTQDQLDKLKADAERTDVFFVAPWGSSIAAYELASRFDKPIAMVGLACRQVDIAAYTRSKGFEAYACSDYDELNRTLALLRARKVLGRTRVLFPTDRGLPAVASITSINDLDELKRRLGVEVEVISYAELAEEMSRVMKSGSDKERAGKIADGLIQQAAETLLDRKYVVSSVQFYQAVANLMAKHNCNAFTIECFEFCSSRLPEQWKVTPCLVHTVLRDEGYAASCEADLGAMLAMRMLMSVAGRSCHMGNANPAGEGDIEIYHSVPGLRMNGFDEPGLPYKLGRFTESGWGTKFVVDFIANDERKVTVARVDPTGTKLLVLAGELVGSGGWEQDYTGCSVKAFIRPPAGRSTEFIQKRLDYGNHLPWVYGDYGQQIYELGRMLGLRVDLIA